MAQGVLRDSLGVRCGFRGVAWLNWCCMAPEVGHGFRGVAWLYGSDLA
jgi:hypothetical protein